VYVIVINSTIYPTTIKITVSDENPIIFQRTAKTLITMHYSSYVDNYYVVESSSAANRNLVSYYLITAESVLLFVITVVNSTTGTTQGILLVILTKTGYNFKRYRTTKKTAKIVCDPDREKQSSLLNLEKFNSICKKSG
jgi:hypothetical protein